MKKNETLDKVICNLEKEKGLYKPRHIGSYNKDVGKYTCYDNRDCEFKKDYGVAQYCKFYEHTILKDKDV